jgi:hypothetical protein
VLNAELFANKGGLCRIKCEQSWAEHDVFDHGPDGRLVYIRAGTPRRLSMDEVSALVGTFAQAFANARQAGFDGVEILKRRWPGASGLPKKLIGLSEI